MTLLSVAEELYGLPLAAFTAARDERAKALRAKAREESDAVKALRKPSLAAWVLNLLVRREPAQIDQLVSVGAALRDAASSLDATQLRALTAQRRQLTAAVTTVARRHALAEGQKVTEAVAAEIEATLTAAMVDAGAAAALQSGLLVKAFATTGVDELDPTAYVAVPDAIGHVASSVPATLHAVPDPSEAERRREARKALAVADKELRIAREALSRAEVRHRGAQAQALQVESEIDELRRRLAELEEREEAAQTAVERAAAAVADAREEVAAAEEAREAAARGVDGD
ncbi:hypothetical protein [Nocardioides jiangxiensis]|uniref:Transposase n=1 Tax=Nocardioides jiangxiensis TaxID=3064524 RepID=A0ABT9B375_9ACTN|nr:hypothetical protein [Nocardioides sp. WY-20]MDO7869306.1 hypothetical protein [Nocardioides sp. WY-20]